LPGDAGHKTSTAGDATGELRDGAPVRASLLKCGAKFICGALCPTLAMVLEEPLTEAEKKKLHSIISNPKALDEVIDKALKGWGTAKAWKKKTRN